MKLRSSFNLRSIFLNKFIFLFLSVFLITGTFLGINILKKQLQASAYTANDFVTTWNSGDDRVVKIPVYKNTNDTGSYGSYDFVPGLSGYNYTVDWGDGSPIETFITGSTDTTNTTPTHTYPNANTEYQIVISGTFPGWTFNYNTNNLGGYTANRNMAKKLTKLNQWGTGTWKRMDFMFSDCSNLEAAYTDSPNTSEVTDMSYMFSSASKFNGVVNFDTSNVTYISGMFSYANSFNQPVNFDTSNVTNMSEMFASASSFNQPLNFDTSNVTNMSTMFSHANSFNQPVNFDTSNVTNMSEMFASASSFNQPLNFDTSNVTDMSGMFSYAISFNQDLSSFDFSKVTDDYGLSYFATSSALSVNNYDKLLNRWHEQLGGNSIAYANVDMSPLKYCKAEAAREHLVKPVVDRRAGWGLTDAGKDCNIDPNVASPGKYNYLELDSPSSQVDFIAFFRNLYNMPEDYDFSTTTFSLTYPNSSPDNQYFNLDSNNILSMKPNSIPDDQEYFNVSIGVTDEYGYFQEEFLYIRLLNHPAQDNSQPQPADGTGIIIPKAPNTGTF